jgi:oligopeptide transport system permease protein
VRAPSKSSLWRRLLSDKAAVAAGLVLLAVGAGAILAPMIAAYSYDFQDTGALLSPPSPAHFLGTDRLGRDLFSRLLYGARVSMTVGIGTALSAVLIGTLYGAISGYAGGRVDNAMMRLVDVLYALPDLLLIIMITVIIGRGVLGILLALSLVSWVTVARIIRGEVLRLREFSFVEAARSLGMSRRRILLLHILPNTLGILIVTLTFRIPTAILTESTLSFIGLGIAPPAASWGTLANEGWAAMKFYPHLILYPSVVIFVTILSFNFLGDALRDALDPADGPGR